MAHCIDGQKLASSITVNILFWVNFDTAKDRNRNTSRLIQKHAIKSPSSTRYLGNSILRGKTRPGNSRSPIVIFATAKRCSRTNHTTASGANGLRGWSWELPLLSWELDAGSFGIPLPSDSARPMPACGNKGTSGTPLAMWETNRFSQR